MDDQELETQWTDAARQRFTAEVAALVEAVQAHGAAVLAQTGARTELPALFAAGDELARAVDSYGDAQWDLTGVFPPVHVHGRDDPDGVDGVDGMGGMGGMGGMDPGEVAGLVRVVHRADFAVTDPAAVLAAGRAAYREVWPDDGDEDAAADVTDLGRALYQVQHAGGLAGLEDVAGLEPLGSTTWYVDVTDEEEPPEDPYRDDSPQLLLRLDETFGPDED